MATEYLLDTNAINAALDQNIQPGRITSRGAVFVTHIQVNELQASKRSERQRALLEALSAIDPAKVSTSAAVWNVSELGGAEWGDANGLYQPLLAALNARNGGKRNNAQDALIGVTAIARGMILVTNDADLAEAVRGLGGAAVSFENFLA
jgi:predicted nucleic acid-binding protein